MIPGFWYVRWHDPLCSLANGTADVTMPKDDITKSISSREAVAALRYTSLTHTAVLEIRYCGLLAS